MRKGILAILGATLITASLLSGCSSLKKDTIIPGEVITKAVNAYEKPKSYYGEAKMEIYENGKLSERSNIKEWVDNSSNKIKKRWETSSDVSGKIISTNDGDQLLLYMEKSKKAMKLKVDSSLISNTNDYKNQLMKELNGISKTHTLTYKGEEKVNGFKTYHLNATPKEKNSLIGNVDYWVDKDNSFVVKSTSESANNKVSMEYTKMEFSPRLDSSLFIQKIPSDIKIDDMSNKSENVIDMNQAAKIAGRPILTLKETSGYKLKSVTYTDMTQIKHKEINQTYEKNGAEELVLTTIVFYDNKVPEESNLKIDDEKEITVRGKKGTAMEQTIKDIAWTEDGFNYNLLIQNPSLSIEDGKKIVESLEYYK